MQISALKMVNRDEGSIPFTRSIDNQALTVQCSKSAVESNWKNQSQEERRSGKRKSFQWEAPKKIPAEEMGITNRQLSSATLTKRGLAAIQSPRKPNGLSHCIFECLIVEAFSQAQNHLSVLADRYTKRCRGVFDGAGDG